MGHEGRAWRKNGRRDAPGKELGMAWGKDAFRIRRVWTGVWEEGYPGDGAVRRQALGLKSVVRGAQGSVRALSSLFPIG